MIITSTRNPRIIAARKLSQRKHRHDQKRFTVEGLQLLHMALDAGYQPEDVFYSPDLFTGETAPALLARCEQSGAVMVEISPEVLQALSNRDTSQGIFAIFPLPNQTIETLHVDTHALVIVLDRLHDPGNVGTILRTADAVGAAGVMMLSPGAHPYDPKTVRASMGSLFNLPVVQVDSAQLLFEWMNKHQLPVIGADATRGARWTTLDWRGGMALVLGSEAQGLSDDLHQHINQWAALPIYGKADSLNVAVAGGVMMYAWAAANR